MLILDKDVNSLLGTESAARRVAARQAVGAPPEPGQAGPPAGGALPERQRAHHAAARAGAAHSAQAAHHRGQPAAHPARPGKEFTLRSPESTLCSPESTLRSPESTLDVQVCAKGLGPVMSYLRQMTAESMERELLEGSKGGGGGKLSDLR
eukprot:1190964-Prorocentrum_minimum.AAC.2